MSESTSEDAQVTGGELAERPGAELPATFTVPEEAYLPFGERQGMWGRTSSDTSGYNGMVRAPEWPGRAMQPFGGWFDAVADRMNELVPGFSTGAVYVFRDEITFHVRCEKLVELARVLRDDPQLRFEFLPSVSGVHYPNDKGAELHVIYQLKSYTHNRRIRLEVTCSDDNPHVPSVVDIYPMANYHERETWDMFGVIFDGHPGLTRILMPDDWQGHPQRKDYAVGGVPIEYKGTVVPPPELRRRY